MTLNKNIVGVTEEIKTALPDLLAQAKPTGYQNEGGSYGYESVESVRWETPDGTRIDVTIRKKEKQNDSTKPSSN